MHVFYKQHFYKQLTNIFRLNLCYLKFIHILHPCYHLKVKGLIQKNKQKNKCLYIHEIIQLIIMKIKIKMKKKPNRYEINRLRSRNGHKYNKYKKFFSMIVLISINQHLSNIWGSVNEKVNRYWGSVEKKILLTKKSLLQVVKDLRFIFSKFFFHEYLFDVNK